MPGKSKTNSLTAEFDSDLSTNKIKGIKSPLVSNQKFPESTLLNSLQVSRNVILIVTLGKGVGVWIGFGMVETFMYLAAERNTTN